jgi:hypothetical protein
MFSNNRSRVILALLLLVIIFAGGIYTYNAVNNRGNNAEVEGVQERRGNNNGGDRNEGSVPPS